MKVYAKHNPLGMVNKGLDNGLFDRFIIEREVFKEFIRLRAVKHDDGSEDVGTVEFTKDFNPL